jgi:hypothetical protein
MAAFVTVSQIFFINCNRILRNIKYFKLGWWNLLLPVTACRLGLPLEAYIPLSDVQATIISLMSSPHHFSLMWASWTFSVGVFLVILNGCLWSLLLRNFLFTNFWLNIDLLCFPKLIHCWSFISTWWLTLFWHFSIRSNLSVICFSPVLWIIKVLLCAHNLLWLYWCLSFKLESNVEVEDGMAGNDW